MANIKYKDHRNQRDQLAYHQRVPDIQFLLMGTGPEHANLVALRDRLGLQAVVDLPGRVSNEFLFTALKSIDVGVSCDPINPYNDHCTMNKTLEYMAFGKAQVMFGTKEADYDATKNLEKATSVLVAINAADDERNPPELGVMERELKKVKNGSLYIIPATADTRGHGTTNMAKLWKAKLAEALDSAPRK